MRNDCLNYLIHITTVIFVPHYLLNVNIIYVDFFNN